MSWLRAVRSAKLAVSRVSRLGVRGWQTALLAGVLAHSLPAHAQEPPLVMLELEGCDELDEAEVRRIVAAELGARSANIAGLNVTQITVKCAGTRVAIFVSDPLSRKSVQRSFDIGLSDPRARGRLVSIAATELVLASWVELETNRKLHVEPIGPAPAPDATIAAREIAKQLLAERYEPKARTWYDVETPHDRMLRFVPLVSTRKFFTHPGTLIGGGLRMGEERFRFLSWSADALFESGTVSQLGNYYDISTGTLGGMVLAYVGSRTVTARLGAGLRVGFANIAAAVGPSSGGALVPWGWPLAATSVTLRFTRYFGVDLGGEGGYVSLPGSSGGQPLFSGFWFSGQAGLTLIVPGPPPNRAPEGEVGE